jgi:hypothetical protein
VGLLDLTNENILFGSPTNGLNKRALIISGN